jgi:hypothetical protein
VFGQSLSLPVVIVSFDETQIEDGRGRRWNHVASEITNVATGEPVDVQRR